MSILDALRPLVDCLDLQDIQALAATGKSVRTALQQLDKEGYWIVRQRAVICNAKRRFPSNFHKYLAAVAPVFGNEESSLYQIAMFFCDADKLLVLFRVERTQVEHVVTVHLPCIFMPQPHFIGNMQGKQFDCERKIGSQLNCERTMGSSYKLYNILSNGAVAFGGHDWFLDTLPFTSLVTLTQFPLSLGYRFFAVRCDGYLFELFTDQPSVIRSAGVRRISVHWIDRSWLQIVYEDGTVRTAGTSPFQLFDPNVLYENCLQNVAEITENAVLFRDGVIKAREPWIGTVRNAANDPFVRVCCIYGIFVALTLNGAAFIGRFWYTQRECPGQDQTVPLCKIADDGAIDCRIVRAEQETDFLCCVAVLDRSRDLSLYFVSTKTIVFLRKIRQEEF